MNRYLDAYNVWKSKVKDQELLQELLNIENDQKEIMARFSQNLQFGTAGIRGIMGAGTGRFNLHLVTKVTMGLCHYLKQNTKKATVVVTYDNRKNSYKFAKLVSTIFASFNMQVFMFSKITPTPVLSYAVRKFGAHLGVNITSSHNSKIYNGYKVVNGSGYQISTQEGIEIGKFIESADEFYEPKQNFDYYLANGKIEILPETVLQDFTTLAVQSTYKKDDFSKDFSVVYSPLNGTGMRAMELAFEKIGLTNYHVPKQERNPDENFTSTPNPNPELPEVYKKSQKLGKKHKSSLLITTDPDCDRLGVMVWHNKKYVYLTGDEIGSALLHYIMKNKLENGQKPTEMFMVTTVVSSPLAKTIALKNKVKVHETLTGFKNIGGKVEEELSKMFLTESKKLNTKTKISNQQESIWQKINKCFIVAYEESNGFMTLPYIRDKDGITPTLHLLVLANELFLQDKTLVDYLTEIKQEYGFYETLNYSKDFVGVNGANKMAEVVQGLRSNNPTQIAGYNVLNVTDYKNTKVTKLESSNFIKFELEDNIIVTVRPSGTEPKLKIYLSVKAQTQKEAVKKLKNLQKYLNKKLFS